MANISTILSNALTVHLRGYLSGLVLSTAGSSATFSVATGVAVDDVQKDFMNLATAISKTTSAWAVGTGNGGIDTGAVANSTWYHVYLIKRPDTGVVDVLFSLSASAPTMPANYTLKRRIGSMKTNGSAQWTLFTQLGDEFLWASAVADVASATLTAGTPVLEVLSVPLGVQVIALIDAYITTTSSTGVLVNSPDQTAVATPTDPGINVKGYANTVGPGLSELRIRTNTSSQVRAAGTATITNGLFINTQGWYDTRGKL